MRIVNPLHIPLSPIFCRCKDDVPSSAAKMLYSCERASVLSVSVLGGDSCSRYCLGGKCLLLCCAAGCMGGNKLDAAAVRKLEKLPTKTQMIGSVAIMVKKVMILLHIPADTRDSSSRVSMLTSPLEGWVSPLCPVPGEAPSLGFDFIWRHPQYLK